MQGLRLKRFEQGWSIRELSEASGVDATTISSMEAGRTNPHARTVKRLADALGCSVAALLSVRVES